MMLSTLLRHRRGRSLPVENDRPSSGIVSQDHGSGNLPLDYSEPKRSGPHNLTRNGYDEEKCRNVLIFLILREHLGDENLDLAGGVLYELIEVDCEHTDDPGAAFQRWRYSHMRRYSDLELPHIPHLTTVTSSIIPTEKLEDWRSKHADRYTFHLSDSSPSTQRFSNDPSCIRNRKAWLIDHTLYVSSRNDGTRPLNSPKPKEFHEMQWNSEFGTQGKLVEERDVTILCPDRPSGVSPPGTADTLLTVSSHSKIHRHSISGLSIVDKLVGKLLARKGETEVEHRRRSWLPGAFMFETASLFREKRGGLDSTSVPLPDDCEIPNAIFARKNLLVDAGDSLPPYLFISHMPTAEAKATETIVAAATVGLLDEAPSWSFRGPFTPQLGFDGGLDYQWSLREPIIIRRRFDIDDPSNEDTESDPGTPPKGDNLRKTERHQVLRGSCWKRRGIIFNSNVVVNWHSSIDRSSEDCKVPVLAPADYSSESQPHHSLEATRVSPPVQTPRNECKLTSLTPNMAEPSSEEGHCLKPRNSLVLENIGVVTPPRTPERAIPTSNRKNTVVELSSRTLKYVPPTLGTNHVERIWLAPRSFTALRGISPSSNSLQVLGGNVKEHGEYDGEPQMGAAVYDDPRVYDSKPDGPRLCGVSQGVTMERLQAYNYGEGAGWDH
ncbi:hypothetical protein F4779DRAFT_638798 [Xylariaceae sp. FL0662B]|nr:hypothetical protein F4779DRAFT_638798 [Xylariaceae sp. FL0662B]